MKKLKIPIVALFLLGGFGATVVMPNIVHAKEITSAKKQLPKWLWKILIDILIEILKHYAEQLKALPVGGTTTGNADMNPVLQNMQWRDGLAQEGVIVTDDQITYTADMPVQNNNDGTGILIPAGTYRIDGNGIAKLIFKKVFVPSPTFPDDEPKED